MSDNIFLLLFTTRRHYSYLCRREYCAQFSNPRANCPIDQHWPVAHPNSQKMSIHSVWSCRISIQPTIRKTKLSFRRFSAKVSFSELTKPGLTERSSTTVVELAGFKNRTSRAFSAALAAFAAFK